MFSRIFVFIKAPEVSKILTDIASIIDCDLVDDHYLEKPGFSISIEKNNDHDLNLAKEFPDGFLYFPFSLEVEIDKWVNLDLEISCLNDMLVYLWQNNYPAVISSTLEDRLMERGGYKSKNTPWIISEP